MGPSFLVGAPWKVLIIHLDDMYFFQGRLLRLGRAVDLRDLKGTRYLCAFNDIEKIASRIPRLKKCISFLGRGDYHYLTYIFLRRLEFPFALLLMDNHLDAKETFKGYISCGSWLKEATKLPHLERIIFIGQIRKKWGKIYPAGPDIGEITKLMGHLPLYISLDKDILSPSYLTTNWDQGAFSLTDLLSLISHLPPKKIVGLDICGEPDGISLYDHHRSEEINLELIKCISCLPSRIHKNTLSSAA